MNHCLCCGLALLLCISTPALSAGEAEIVYDHDQDQLGILAKNATLSQLFAQLAQQAGIASQIESTVATDQLSVNQPSRPTMDAFTQLLRRYNHILYYRADSKNQKRISSVTILGAVGKTGGGSTTLPPVQHAATKRWDTEGIAPVEAAAEMSSPDAGQTGSVSSREDLPAEVQASGVPPGAQAFGGVPPGAQASGVPPPATSVVESARAASQSLVTPP